MSKAAFWQRGESIDFTNATTDVIEANTVMAFGSRICVAGTDILPGETGSVHVTGVFAFPKGDGKITAGAEVYYSEADGEVTTEAEKSVDDPDNEGKTKTVNLVKAGFAVSGAAADDNKVLVKINA